VGHDSRVILEENGHGSSFGRRASTAGGHGVPPLE